MVESQALRLAREACQTGRPLVFDCEMTNLDADVDAAVCGGNDEGPRRSDGLPGIARALTRPLTL